MKWQTLDVLNNILYIEEEEEEEEENACCPLVSETNNLCSTGTPLRSFLKSRFSRFHTFLVLVGVRVRLSISFAPRCLACRLLVPREDFRFHLEGKNRKRLPL